MKLEPQYVNILKQELENLNTQRTQIVENLKTGVINSSTIIECGKLLMTIQAKIDEVEHLIYNS